MPKIYSFSKLKSWKQYTGKTSKILIQDQTTLNFNQKLSGSIFKIMKLGKYTLGISCCIKTKYQANECSLYSIGEVCSEKNTWIKQSETNANQTEPNRVYFRRFISISCDLFELKRNVNEERESVCVFVHFFSPSDYKLNSAWITLGDD